MKHRYEIKKSSFDGFYTYFASNGFSYGSTWKNWKGLAGKDNLTTRQINVHVNKLFFKS